MSRLDKIFAFHVRYGFLGYTANNYDQDFDHIPARADVDDGDGLDCSGDVWAAFRFAWAPDPPPFILSSTSGYALMAEHANWWVSLNDLKPGDILLHSTNGNVFRSDGPAGHTEIYRCPTPGRPGWIECDGSSGGGKGVGTVSRQRTWWNAAFRVPGLDAGTPAPPPIDWEAVKRILEEMDEEHGLAVDVDFDDLGRALTLDRWGGLHLEDTPAVQWTTPAGFWKPNQDVYRRVKLTRKSIPLAGYVLDQDGVLWPFAEKGSPLPKAKGPAHLTPGKIVAFPLGT